MDNEISKKDNKQKNQPCEIKVGMQDILAGFLTVVMLFVVLVMFSGATDRRVILFVVAMVSLFLILGVVFISGASGVVSIIKFIKRKKELALLEKKESNRWFIFDMFFFLFLPVLSLYMIYFKTFRENISFVIIFIILASGIKALLQNRDGRILSRVSAWLLVLFASFPLIISVSSFLIIKFWN